MKRIWIGASTVAASLATLGGAGLYAQQGPGRDAERGAAPTEAMLQACMAKQERDICSVDDLGGASSSGICMAPQGRPLACVPGGERPVGGPNGAGGGAPGGASGPPPPQSNSGTKLSDTQSYTLGILCDYAVDKQNEQIGLSSKAQWSCERGQRVLSANGVPDHAVGQFPNPANANAIAEHTVNFAVTTSPVRYSGPGGRVKEPVMGLNGIKFDPGTGGRCPDDIADPAQCGLGGGSSGKWIIEAMGQDDFDFGTDENNAHVQPDGTYHYHGIPEGMLSAEAKAGQRMAIIGWAADGFPVYARYGYPTPNLMLGELKLMQPSYRLKSSPDADRPSVEIVPMGAFMQDWEYVVGLGDLDECNGRFGSTPEFPEGIYHYFATDAYPYIQRCVKGSVDSEPRAREGRGGVRRGEGGRGRRGGGEGGRGPGRTGGQ